MRALDLPGLLPEDEARALRKQLAATHLTLVPLRASGPQEVDEEARGDPTPAMQVTAKILQRGAAAAQTSAGATLMRVCMLCSVR